MCRGHQRLAECMLTLAECGEDTAVMARLDQLRQLRPVVRSLSVNATKTLVQAFILCRLDYCNSLLFGISDDYFDACSRCRTLPPAWSQAPVGVTTPHQCYGSCTGCQSVSALCSRSRGLYICRLVDWLPRTSQTTVAFCWTLAVAHCGPTPMTCGSCLCHEHITNSVIGVSRPPTVERPSTWTPAAGTYLRLFQTFSENPFIWLPKLLVTV